MTNQDFDMTEFTSALESIGKQMEQSLSHFKAINCEIPRLNLGTLNVKASANLILHQMRELIEYAELTRLDDGSYEGLTDGSGVLHDYNHPNHNPPAEIEPATDLEIAVALAALAEAGVPTDIQEVLVYGNDRPHPYPPGALHKAINAVLAPRIQSTREQAVRECAEIARTFEDWGDYSGDLETVSAQIRDRVLSLLKEGESNHG